MEFWLVRLAAIGGAVARGQTVDLMWLNKGPHKFGVSSFLPDAAIADRCRVGGYDAVLLFHNHPNSRPQYLDMSQPSPRDIETADLLGSYLDQRDVALAEFVCERGVPYCYFRSAPDALYPLLHYRRRGQRQERTVTSL
ncbi:MAG TPA: hypothetical protein QGH28_04395 [Chloroflexota bacterium]|nr:hypothetical protein [Chloroflexota bacterium]